MMENNREQAPDLEESEDVGPPTAGNTEEEALRPTFESVSLAGKLYEACFEEASRIAEDLMESGTFMIAPEHRLGIAETLFNAAFVVEQQNRMRQIAIPTLAGGGQMGIIEVPG